MSQSPPNAETLKLFVQCLHTVPDPRSKHGTHQPFGTILAIIFLGLIGNRNNPTAIARWTEQHFQTLKKFLPFGKRKGKIRAPCHNTLTRILKKLSLQDLQEAFAQFLNLFLNDADLVAAVDGKTAKQMKDENGEPLHMLNVFAHSLKLHLASWSVKGDKTNEPGCLKQHLGELFTMFPGLKLLTGDALFAGRPLLKALQEYERDYLMQVKGNQPNVAAKMEAMFKDVEPQEQNSHSYHSQRRKKRGFQSLAVCG